MRGDEVALGVDAPAAADLGELVAERPAVGPLLALVLGAGALQRHAAGVVADRADRGDVLVAEALLGRQRRQLGALVLDRARLGAGLLDQGRGDALDRRVGEVPLAGELDRGQPGALGEGQQPLELLQPGLDPAVGPEGAVVGPAPAPCPGRRSPQKRPP